MHAIVLVHKILIVHMYYDSKVLMLGFYLYSFLQGITTAMYSYYCVPQGESQEKTNIMKFFKITVFSDLKMCKFVTHFLISVIIATTTKDPNS